MKDSPMTDSQPWQDWVNLVLGAWLVLAPFFGVGAANDAAAWNAYISGGLVAIFAIASLARWQPWEEWVNLAIGLWLIAAPFALGFWALAAPTWNQIIVGLAVGVAAVWSLMERRTPMPHHPA